MRIWGRLFRWLQYIEDGVLVTMLAVMTIAAFGQVLNRNFFLLPISWLEELSRYCMIYMTVFAAEKGLRDGSQISIDGVVNKFDGKPKLLIMIIANFALMAFAATVFCYSVPLLMNQIRSGQLSPALRIPMSIPYFAMCIGFGSIFVTQLVALLKKVCLLFAANNGKIN